MSEKWDFLGFSGAKIAKIDENLAPKFCKFEKTVEKLEKTWGKACKAMLHAVCACSCCSKPGVECWRLPLSWGWIWVQGTIQEKQPCTCRPKQWELVNTSLFGFSIMAERPFWRKNGPCDLGPQNSLQFSDAHSSANF